MHRYEGVNVDAWEHVVDASLHAAHHLPHDNRIATAMCEGRNMKLRTITTAAAAGLALLALAACSGPADEPTPTETPDVEVTESASPSPDAEETETEISLPGDLTPPGTELKVGDTATVLWNHYEHGAITLDVTVDTVRTGSLDELREAGVSDDTMAQIDGYTPYYIDFTIVKADLSQGEIVYSSANEVRAVNSKGADLVSLTLFGRYEPCNSGSFAAGVDEGEPQTSCVIYLVPGGQEFGAATWSAYDTPYARYDGEPVLWWK